MRVRRPSVPARYRAAGGAAAAFPVATLRVRQAAFLILTASLIVLLARDLRGGGPNSSPQPPQSLSRPDGTGADDAPNPAVRRAASADVGPNTQEQRENARRYAKSRPPPSSGTRRDAIRDSERGPPLLHRIPNVLLVGAQKAGTTAVANFLADAGVCNAVVEGDDPDFFAKEVQFFNDAERYAMGLPFYSDRFSHCPEGSLIMDATPNYLTKVRRIRAAYDEAGGDQARDVKVVVLLREPISRELSWYNHLVHQLKRHDPPEYAYMVAKDVDKPGGPNAEVITFSRYVQEQTMALLVGPTASYETATPPCHQDKYSEFPPCFGLYAHFLGEWFEWFGRNQTLVLSYDELQNNPSKMRWRLMKFLDLDPERVRKVGFSTANQQKSNLKVNKPGCQVTNLLRKVFEPKNEELYRLLEKRPGMYMEERPFPKFTRPECVMDG